MAGQAVRAARGEPLDIADGYEQADTLHFALNTHADEALDELDAASSVSPKSCFRR
ncbi:MAG: hypothetical protein R3E95_13465 [Thiolinea sp.]